MSRFAALVCLRWILAAVLVSEITYLPARAADYFVATNGSDANPGTNLLAPFQTLHQAATKLNAGDVCWIRAGVYHETLAPANSGNGAASITFAAYSNDVVTIDAADSVGGWSSVSNGVYQASVDWDLGMGCNQVFVDGAMIHQAQLPDYGGGDVLHPGLAPVVVDAGNTNRITSSVWSGKPDNYWAGAWFVGGVGNCWAWQSARALASTGAVITVDAATETPNWWFTGSGAGYLLGQLNLLDADNEWDLETNAGAKSLYLRISGGTDPSSHLVEMKRRNWCIDINGRNGIVVSNLNLWSGAVRLKGNGNALQNCRAQYLSHYVLLTQGYFENGGVEQGDGVEVNGNQNTISGCTIANTAGSGVYTSGSSNRIARNVISNTDYSGSYACGIALHGAGDVVIFNTAFSSGRDIVRPEGNGADIRFNDLSSPGLLCKDLGVTYQWGVNGGGTRIAYNWAHDNASTPYAPGIYIDNWCRNFVVDHNVIWNCPIFDGVLINGPSTNNLIYNNTLFNCYNIGAHPYDQWPSPNPDPAFWTTDIYTYSASNNLFLAASPQSQLVDWTNRDFRLKPGAAAIDAGQIIPGFTDGYLGSAPDLGAYEYGALPWTAGVGSNPLLTVAIDGGGNLALLASPDAAYYRLYSTTNLTTTALWSAVTNAPVVSDYQWSLSLPVSSTATRFYRLQSQ